MSKTSRWATIVGVVCGAELVFAIVIGGAGLAALVSIEAAIVAALLGGALLWVMHDRRQRSRPTTDPSETTAPWGHAFRTRRQPEPDLDTTT